MNRMFAIVTHHERLDDSAEAWKECDVCAIGWSHFGRLTKAKKEDLPSDARRFLKIGKGDVILAYAGGNRIAYVGNVVNGKYRYTTKNLVGRSKEKADLIIQTNIQ